MKTSYRVVGWLCNVLEICQLLVLKTWPSKASQFAVHLMQSFLTMANYRATIWRKY